MVGLRMGVFTYDPVVVQDFMHAGLPVWFIRPYNVLHTAIINTVVNVRLPGDYLCLEDVNPPLDRKSTRLNSSHPVSSRMPSSA